MKVILSKTIRDNIKIDKKFKGACMKIAFTATGNNWDSKMDPKFGRMKMLMMYDEGTKELQVISNKENQEIEDGACLQTANKVIDFHPAVIITGNRPEQKALEVLKRFDIKMYVGAGEMTLKEAYEAYKADKLTRFDKV